MIRFLMWPFVAIIALCRKVIIFISAVVFIVVFCAVLWGFFTTFNNIAGKASLTAMEVSFSLIFGTLPLWVIIISSVVAVVLWYRHKVLGSAVAGAVSAIVAGMWVLI